MLVLVKITWTTLNSLAPARQASQEARVRHRRNVLRGRVKTARVVLIQLIWPHIRVLVQCVHKFRSGRSKFGHF